MSDARDTRERIRALFGEQRMELLDKLMDILRLHLSESPERWLGASELAELILTLVKQVPEEMREEMGMATGDQVNPFMLLVTGIAMQVYDSPEADAARVWETTRKRRN